MLVHHILSGALSTGLLATSLFSQSLQLPAGSATAEGSASANLPWNSSGIRVQYVYDAQAFIDQGIRFPITISGQQWRADSGTAMWTGSTLDAVTIKMGPAAFALNAQSATFDSNFATETTVFSGPVSIPPGMGNGAGVPGPFYVSVSHQPITYDPRTGNGLVIDVEVGTSTSGGSSTPLDAFNLVDDPNLLVVRNLSLLTGSPTATVVGERLGAVVELQYTAVNGLYPAFSADVRSGPSPLTVQFTDETVTTDPGGPLAWLWDFDNDGTIDSVQQNPVHTFTTCGPFDVKLEVIDSTHGLLTLLEQGYIVTDAVDADFVVDTRRGTPPLTVQFTDTSTGSPTAWSWDFDGDGSIDSMMQNPSYVYSGSGMFSPTLTVSRNCMTDTETKPDLIETADVLCTAFDGTQTLSAGGAHLFDAMVLDPDGIYIESIEVNTNAPIGATITLEFAVTSEGIVGKELTPTAWRIVATGSGTSAGPGQPSRVVLGNPAYLPSAAYGWAVICTDQDVLFTAIAGATQTHANPVLSLTLGASQTAPFTSAPNAQTLWNGCFRFEMAPTVGSYDTFGEGCPGSQGVAALTPRQLPRVNTTFVADIGPMPANSVAIMLMGFSARTWTGGTLPVHLLPFGMRNCFGRVRPDNTIAVLADGTGVASWPIAIPNIPASSRCGS